MTSNSPPTAAPAPAWHTLPVSDALGRQGVDPEQGLAEDEAAQRLQRHGPNSLPEPAGRSALMRFLSQLKEPLVLVLIGSGIATSALGEWVDSSVIFGVVIVNAVIGYLQEGKAEAALAALARALATEVTVLRDGRRPRARRHGFGHPRHGTHRRGFLYVQPLCRRARRHHARRSGAV